MKNHKNGTAGLFFSFTLDFLAEYLPKQAGRSSATIDSYRDSLSLFRRYLTNTQNISIRKFRFSDCNRDCIFGFRVYLKQRGNEPSTINVRIAAIRAYLFYAADKDIALQSVALSIADIPKFPTVKKEKPLLMVDALAAILNAPPETKMGLRDRCILIILYDSAMRLNELLSITMKDIGWAGKEPYVLLHGKGNKERHVVLTEKTGRHLKEYLKVFHPACDLNDYLFYTKIKGQTGKMSRSNVQRLINQYAGSVRETCAGVPDAVHPHMFRRTRATDLYRDGVALELVSVLLGHEQLETTKIYAIPSLEQMRDAIESVPSPAADEKPLWIGSEDEMARRCGLR